MAQHRFVLKADVRRYFPSIDHQILGELLGRAVKCAPTLRLAATVIAASDSLVEEAVTYFPGDDLFTPIERRRGLPIGNQTSQFLANVYLNPLDHFVRRELRPSLYLRYVDDFVLFSNDGRGLERMRRATIDFLGGLRLSIHEGKSRVFACDAGLTFLGWRLFPDRLRLPRAHVVRARRRLRKLADRYNAGELAWVDLNARIQAWLGHAAFGDTAVLRQNIFDSCILIPAAHGRNCAARGLLEQQSNERPRLEPQQERANEPQQ